MAQGLLLIVVGVWLLLQTLVGDLPSRVLSLRNASFGKPSMPTTSGAV